MTTFPLPLQLLLHLKSKKMDMFFVFFFFAAILTAVAGLVWQSFNGNRGVYSSSAGGDHAAGRQ